MVLDCANMEKLDADLFVRGRIEHLSFENEIPEELTGDKYLIMYKKIWAIIRHDLWKDIMAKKKELRCKTLPEAEFDQLYEEKHRLFENIRVEVYAMIMDEPSIE